MLKNIVRKQYIAKFDQLKSSNKISRPNEGWIRTLRKALGMSISQLAARLNLSKAQVSQIERMELEDRVSIKQLRRVADTMDCDLVYALVPRKAISEQIHDRAQLKAASLVNKTNAQMTLEAQQLSKDALRAQIEAETERLIKEMPRNLWDD